MPIPQAALAFAPPDKLSDYLLDQNHPVGGSKANWFLTLGFDPANAAALEDALLDQVRNSEDFVEKLSPFGKKYVVTGRIITPHGTPANVVTIWIVEPSDSRPRLVTAYPGDKS